MIPSPMNPIGDDDIFSATTMNGLDDDAFLLSKECFGLNRCKRIEHEKRSVSHKGKNNRACHQFRDPFPLGKITHPPRHEKLLGR